MTVEEGAVDAATGGTDVPSDTPDQGKTEAKPKAEDTVSRRELEKAIAARNKVKADRDAMALRMAEMEKQVEELSASDATKALEIAQRKAEKLEKELADVSGKLTQAERGRKIDRIYSQVSKKVSADEDVLELAWHGLLSQGALDDALEEGDADAALKALKKKAPSLFKERAPAATPDPGSGLVPPTKTTNVPSLQEQSAAAAAEVFRIQGRRVENPLAPKR